MKKNPAPSLRPYRNLLIASACLLVAAGQASAQLIENASFEDAGAAETEPAGWTVFGDQLRRETTWYPKKSGSAVLGYGHWRVNEAVPAGIWQDVKGIQKGDQVVFSINLIADPCPSDQSAPESVELILESTVDGKQVTVASKKVAIGDLPAGDEWQSISVEGTVPADSLRVMILVTPSAQSNRSSALKFDDAELSVTKGS